MFADFVISRFLGVSCFPRVAQELNRNRKSERSEPLCQEPKAEPPQPLTPKGPKIEKKNQGRPPGLTFSSEIDNFKRAAHQTPILCWGGEGNSEGQD